MLIDDAGAFVAAFAAPASYSAGGVSAPILAVVEDTDPWTGICTALRTTVDHGQVRLGKAWVRPSELPAAPAFGHLLEQDGRTWFVADSWPESDMLVLGLALGVFVVDVTVTRIVETDDGAMGFAPAPVLIWTGQAAVHALAGKERVAAARLVGLGYRHGWLPACPELAAGCEMRTPHEVLHVTSAYTDHARGWTTFEAEARQEDQP
ncbi:hypothetical protein DVDV_0111 [Desulfovibrio sp. DV]|uniref:hypothetical protein n=1 Tax=Desulfovibrio sp. DV TaxID=1844708 RepID=UPI00094B9A36|nr:hypothetical protein [Desulfovibrio sp. DV]OLN31323.1 hypothetical protein DVDV_0111 [Desulfovibrio sp. DV]